MACRPAHRLAEPSEEVEVSLPQLKEAVEEARRCHNQQLTEPRQQLSAQQTDLVLAYCSQPRDTDDGMVRSLQACGR